MQGFCAKKLNLFKILAENTCYSYNCATVISEDSLFGTNKGVPKLQQIFVCLVGINHANWL